MTAFAVASGAHADALVLRGATLVDGVRDAPTPDSVVVIEGERITCAGAANACEAPDGVDVVDLSGSWITPGLIDTHVHLFKHSDGEARRDQTVRFAMGITSARDAGTSRVRRALQEMRESATNHVARPRLMVAARVSGDNYEEFLPGAPRDPDRLVEILAAQGVQQIKLKDDYTVDEAVAVVKAAVAHGLPSFGHTWAGDIPPREFHGATVEAGLSGVTHLEGIKLAAAADPALFANARRADVADEDLWRWHKERWLVTSDEALDDTLRQMVARGVWLEPTLAHEFHFGTRLEYPKDLDYLNGTPADRSWKRWRKPGEAPEFAQPYEQMQAAVKRFHDQGGVIVTGIDDVLPGLDMLEELRLLRRAGLTPMEALRCATRNAATALGLGDQLGIVQPGYLADLVVYGKDPLGPVENMREVRWIVKGGVTHRPEEVLHVAELWQLSRLAWYWGRKALKYALPVVAVAVVGLFVARRRRGRPTTT